MVGVEVFMARGHTQIGKLEKKKIFLVTAT